LGIFPPSAWRVGVKVNFSVLNAIENFPSFSPPVLRAEFETPPYSSHVAVGRQKEMRCFPPKGNPQPRLYWTR